MSRISRTGGAQASAADGLDRSPAAPRRALARPRGWDWPALALAALASLPILAILLAAPSGGVEAIVHMAGTVLPRYVLNTSALMLLTGALAGIIGVGCAWLVTAAEFPGRRVLGWALVMPLAVPAYIAAYIYADLLDYAGPVQVALRGALGEGASALVPQVRSLPGGAFILAIVLYPYVYLLARAAFAAQSLAQFRAARSLGATPSRAFWRIALPAARPAIAGGLALVLMETLADFGVAEYFAIPTFSTGIFRSWLAMGDKQVALKLAAIMLLFVIVLVALEASTRSGLSESRDARKRGETPLVELSPAGRMLASLACALPVLLGFAVPALHLAWLATSDAALGATRDLAAYASDSLWLGLATALACLAAALLLAFARSRSASPLVGGAIRLATLGYALPGALLAVGLLAPLGALDIEVTRFARDTLGYAPGGLLLTGTSLVLIYALSVRFLTVAFNSIESGMAKIPANLDAAARSLGAGPGRVLARIHAPMLAPSLGAAAALVFIDTLRELPATLILRPFNLETLATRTYRLASDERLAEASIPALILLAAGILPVILLHRTARR